mgnify:FL=1
MKITQPDECTALDHKETIEDSILPFLAMLPGVAMLLDPNLWVAGVMSGVVSACYGKRLIGSATALLKLRHESRPVLYSPRPQFLFLRYPS